MDQPYRIMLVEDSRTQAARMQALLEEQGWNVLWAPTGEEAIEKIGDFVPDLILVDYHLPGILGDEVCRQVRMRIDTRIIAVIMLTADDEREVEARGLESGADDFVHKTNDHESLLIRVKTLLKRSRTNLSILSPKDQFFRCPRLLAVDDSLTFLTHLKHELSKESYQFETATTADEAMKRLNDEAFDCVLVDMVMPKTDGITLCRQIDVLRREGNAAMAILVLTANDDKEGLTRALEAGADDFVGKSSDITVLKVRIRAALRRKFYEEENRRIVAELKDKELEAERARLEKESAVARAAMADRLEQANEELKRFAHVGHHHMQQPLRTAGSYCQLMQKRYGGKIDAQADKFMQSTIDAVARMKSLLGDLLTYSNLIGATMRWSQVDCGKLVDAVFADVDVDAVRLHRGDLPVIEGDQGQLRKLFQCLIDNALKYRREQDAEVRVEAEACDDGRWRFSVRDNGVGIPAKAGDRIFSIFERLYTEAEYPGTGLGLAICRKIAEAHGGTIGYESKLDEGTVFEVRLPESHAADQSAAA